MQETIEKYIYCPEARIIRFEVGKTPYQGLCTSGVSVCAIFCYQSADKQRLSLIHVNYLTTKATLLKEAQWIGQGGHCRVYSKNVQQRDLINNKIINSPGLDLIKDPEVKASCNYEMQVINHNVEGFIFKANGEVALLNDLDNIECIYHPNHSQLEVCLKLHTDLCYSNKYGFLFTGNNQLRQQFLIFDGQAWQEVGSHDLVLHPEIQKILQEFNLGSSPSFLSIQRIILSHHKLKLIQTFPGFEQTSNFTQAWHKLSAQQRSSIEQNMDGDIQHSAAAIATMILRYVYGKNLKDAFINSIRDELTLEPLPQTVEEKALARSINDALKANDPVASVCNILKPLKRDTEFKSNIIGIVLGVGGLLPMYQDGSHGKWLSLSSVKKEICECETIGLAFRTVAAKGKVNQLKDLAQIVHNIDASGKSGRTALHFAASQNTAEMVACLLELGANANLTDAEGKKPIDNCATPEAKALLEAHTVKNEI